MTPYKQIYPAQCQLLAQMGYKTLINLRFDDECPNQPTSDALALAAQNAHLNYQHFPINSDEIDNQAVQAFAELYNACQPPIMVFCNTGNRAKRLYQNAKILSLID